MQSPFHIGQKSPPTPTNIWLLSSVWKGTISFHTRVTGIYRLQLRSPVMKRDSQANTHFRPISRAMLWRVPCGQWRLVVYDNIVPLVYEETTVLLCWKVTTLALSLASMLLSPVPNKEQEEQKGRLHWQWERSKIPFLCGSTYIYDTTNVVTVTTCWKIVSIKVQKCVVAVPVCRQLPLDYFNTEENWKSYRFSF